MDTERVLADVQSAVRGEHRFNRWRDVHVGIDAGAVVLEGQVDSVAVKKLLLARAAAHPAVAGVVDRLRVAPMQHMGDGEIRDRLRDALLAEPALTEVALREVVKGRTAPVRESAGARGDISIRVENGIVILDGRALTAPRRRDRR
jgi:osmotically-inducible protein OsmY